MRDPLTSEEIRDIEQSRKEFEEGKGKHFKNAKELIKWLHETNESFSCTKGEMKT